MSVFILNHPEVFQSTQVAYNDNQLFHRIENNNPALQYIYTLRDNNLECIRRWRCNGEQGIHVEGRTYDMGQWSKEEFENVKAEAMLYTQQRKPIVVECGLCMFTTYVSDNSFVLTSAVNCLLNVIDSMAVLPCSETGSEYTKLNIWVTAGSGGAMESLSALRLELLPRSMRKFLSYISKGPSVLRSSEISVDGIKVINETEVTGADGNIIEAYFSMCFMNYAVHRVNFCMNHRATGGSSVVDYLRYLRDLLR